MPKKKVEYYASEQENFRHYITKVQRSSEDTFKTYWSLVKQFPYFSLKEDDEKEIVGLILRNSESSHQLRAARSFLKYQLWKIKNDDDVEDQEYTDYVWKKNTIMSNLKTDEIEKKKKFEGIEEHYIYKKDLVEMLEKAAPERARFWAVSYLLGTRWHETKTLSDEFFYPERSEHGIVRIPEDRTKSKASRDIKLYSDWFWKIIKEVSTGDFRDKSRKIWKNVYFPYIKQDKENYQLGKKYNGKIYGLLGDLGMSPRTLHSFRHTRITDLLKAENKPIKEVQDRAGHKKTDSTNHYTQIIFDRDPESLEQYIERKNLNLLDIIEN